MFCLQVNTGKKPCHACHAVTPHRNCSVNTIIADSLTEQVYVDGGASLKTIQCNSRELIIRRFNVENVAKFALFC